MLLVSADHVRITRKYGKLALLAHINNHGNLQIVHTVHTFLFHSELGGKVKGAE